MSNLDTGTASRLKPSTLSPHDIESISSRADPEVRATAGECTEESRQDAWFENTKYGTYTIIDKTFGIASRVTKPINCPVHTPPTAKSVQSKTTTKNLRDICDRHSVMFRISFGRLAKDYSSERAAFERAWMASASSQNAAPSGSNPSTT